MNGNSEPFLRLRDVEATYGQAILALRGVSLKVEEGGIVALLGANGAGKTTTLKAISNLLGSERGAVNRGSITWRGRPIERAGPSELVTEGLVQVLEGRISVQSFSGQLSADIRRGPIDGRDLSGTLRLEAGIGSVTLTGARLSPNGLLRLRTFNGDVRLSLAERPADARIMALALNGQVRSDIPLHVRDTWGPRWSEATLGKGEHRFEVVIAIGRAAADMQREVDLGVGGFSARSHGVADGPLSILACSRVASLTSAWTSAADHAKRSLAIPIVCIVVVALAQFKDEMFKKKFVIDRRKAQDPTSHFSRRYSDSQLRALDTKTDRSDSRDHEVLETTGDRR